MTTQTKTEAQEVTIKKCRLSFPNLRTKTASVAGGKEKFGCNFIIDPSTPHGKDAVAKLKKAIAAAEVATFGAGKEGVIAKTVDDPKRIAVRPGSKFKNADGEVYDGYENMIGISCSADKRPTLFDRNKNEVDVEDIEDVFVGGYTCDAVVRLFCVKDKDKGGNGLFAQVKGIRSWQEGEVFGSAPVSADAFDDIDEDDGMGSPLSDDDDVLSGL